MSSRPSLETRPTRGVAGVVAEMFGTEPEAVKTSNRQAVKTTKQLTVNTAAEMREKTSFAISPHVKRHLTVLKLDLRDAGHRVTEAEIVETLIAQADAEALARTFQAKGHKKSSRRKPG